MKNWACLLALLPFGALAQERTEAPAVEVVGKTRDLAGVADSAAQGVIPGEALEPRPILRPGEVLEFVPGLIITQHSGDGKANQYFLRGFNLDHGTDFAVWVAGMPVNMPTHAHGQGYSDLNFLIPELVSDIGYRKGPYYAGEGDFSAAGAARIGYYRRLPQGMAELGVGENGFRRGLVAGSREAGPGELLYAAEVFYNDGPWDQPEDLQKYNGVLRWTSGGGDGRWGVTAMAYNAHWDASDQIAQRAVDSGLVGRFGTLDPSDGGETYRYSLSGDWEGSGSDWVASVNVYGIAYKLDLFSNFTYFLNDPVNGDQFEQYDRRFVSGGEVRYTKLADWGGRAVENTVGMTLRNDNIAEVGLHNTRARQRLSTVRSDNVVQTSGALFVENVTRWTSWFRSTAGLRADWYHFDVESDLPANSGSASDNLISPKLALVFGPFRRTEFYLNYGEGFHSNDARGTVIRVDPASGAPASPVQPLVKAKGSEVGVRSELLQGWLSTLSVWQLDLDSELLYVGDAGTTEASRASRRYGVEWAHSYAITPKLAADLDLAWTHARFSEDDPAGDYIPGAIEKTVSAGLTWEQPRGPFGSVRLRFFGPRPLIEDDSVRSSSSTLVNARAGWKFDGGWKLALDVFNLFDREVDDIAYYYESRLRGEPAAGVPDIHFHPAEPRSFRLSLTGAF